MLALRLIVTALSLKRLHSCSLTNQLRQLDKAVFNLNRSIQIEMIVTVLFLTLWARLPGTLDIASKHYLSFLKPVAERIY